RAAPSRRSGGGERYAKTARRTPGCPRYANGRPAGTGKSSKPRSSDSGALRPARSTALVGAHVKAQADCARQSVFRRNRTTLRHLWLAHILVREPVFPVGSSPRRGFAGICARDAIFLFRKNAKGGIRMSQQDNKHDRKHDETRRAFLVGAALGAATGTGLVTEARAQGHD